MKRFIILAAIGVLVVGCASTPPHRAAYYETNTGERVVKAAASSNQVTQPVAVAMENAKLLSVYPECADRNTSMMDMWNCVREIDAKEGRVKAGERANMEDLSKR